MTQALSENIAIYSPHTAVDAAPGGVNDWLCDVLGSGESRPIEQTLELDPEQALKLVTFIPTEHAEALRMALGRAGAGRIGNYFECAASSPGQGSFRPGEGANPYIGSVGQTEVVEELRVEMVCARKHLALVSEALKQAHPYEEAAWEVYALEPRPRHASGMGRLHELGKPATLAELVSRVKVGLGPRLYPRGSERGPQGGAADQPRPAVCVVAPAAACSEVASERARRSGAALHRGDASPRRAGSRRLGLQRDPVYPLPSSVATPQLAQRVRDELPELELVIL
ncbi:MAG: Nif3-like dinuclear metal center hexameric protein [Polyangiaceae bacterium]